MLFSKLSVEAKEEQYIPDEEQDTNEKLEEPRTDPLGAFGHVDFIQ